MLPPAMAVERDIDLLALNRRNLEELIEPGTHFWKLWNRDETIGGDRTNSGWDFKLLLSLYRQGWDLPAAAPVIYQHRLQHGAPTEILSQMCTHQHDSSTVCGTEYLPWTWLEVIDLAVKSPAKSGPLFALQQLIGINAAFSVQSEVLRRGGRDHHDTALAFMASKHKNGRCFMSPRKLAPQIGLGKSQANEVLKWLCQEGFTSIHKKGRASHDPSKRLATVWNLLFLQVDQAAQPDEIPLAIGGDV